MQALQTSYEVWDDSFQLILCEIEPSQSGAILKRGWNCTMKVVFTQK